MYDLKTILNKNNEQPSEWLMDGLKLATERACRRYFRTNRCEVDMLNKGVNIEFVLPRDKAAIETLKTTYGVEYDAYDVMVPVFLPLNNLPKRIISMTRRDLPAAINAVKEINKYNEWRPRRDKIVEGVVTYDTGKDHIEIDVNGTTCILHKRYMIKEEASFLYKKGKTAVYHVIKVKFGRNDTFCKIMLSRRTLVLPQLLLKSNLPMYDFKCIKRYPGKISWVESNAPFRDKNVKEALKNVRKELSGEKIQLKTQN